jgi:RNA polymerase sigma-70 factor (ECF subfamily)
LNKNDRDASVEMQPPDAEGPVRLATFDQYRSLLFSVAYRMLGTVADAEDMLQETFMRWQQASDREIRSPRAYLVTIISRLCINHLQSARVQREEYVGTWLPEPIVTGPGSGRYHVPQASNAGARHSKSRMGRGGQSREFHRDAG